MYKVSKIVHFVPSILVVLLIFFESSYNSLLSFGQNTPFYDLIIIFCFCFFWPGSISFMALLILGLLKDYVMMMPIGFSAMAFIVLRFFLERQLILVKDRSFLVIMIFFLVALIATCLAEIIILLSIEDVGAWPLACLYLHRVFYTILLYVPVYYIFSYLSQKSSIENGQF